MGEISVAKNVPSKSLMCQGLGGGKSLAGGFGGWVDIQVGLGGGLGNRRSGHWGQSEVGSILTKELDIRDDQGDILSQDC